MRNYIIIASTALAAFSFTACDSGSNQEQQNTASAGEAKEAVAGDIEAISEEKKELIPYAAQASMLQVELGKVAVAKGQTDEVKQYGQQMIDLYSSKKQELQDFASSHGVTLPQSLEEDEQKKVQELQEKKAEDFDMAYWDKVVDAHKGAIGEFNSVLKPEDEATAAPFSVWARNTMKEKQAQMEQAMRVRLAQKDIMRKRSGI